MKKLLVVVVLLTTTLFVALNANEKGKNDVAVQTASSEQSAETAKVETNDVYKIDENSSNCSAEVYDERDSYCGARKIKFYNTCDKRCYVRFQYTVSSPGRATETKNYSGWLGANRRNETLIDCNKNVNIEVKGSVNYGPWED